MIIDCHTHCYPEVIVSQPRKWAEACGEFHWADLVAPKNRKSIQGWANPEKFLAEMDRAGVDRAVLMGWYWEHESTCRWHNEIIAEWISLAPKRFIGFATVFPNENIIEQLEHAFALGLRGVGELHPGLQGFDSKSEHWQAMADWCVAHNWPINCHATAASGKDHPSAIATPLEDYVRMAQNKPELKLILAHWGGGLPLISEDGLPDNLYFDCAASPLLYKVAPFREVIDAVGPERILFGSDYPLRVYPRRQKDAEMTTFLNTIHQEPALTEAEMDAILGQNLSRILGGVETEK